MIYLTVLVNKLITFRIPIKFLLIFSNDYWPLACRHFERAELGPVFLSLMGQHLLKVRAERSSGIKGLLGCFGNKEKTLKVADNKGLCSCVKDKTLQVLPSLCHFHRKGGLTFQAADKMLCTNDDGINYYQLFV